MINIPSLPFPKGTVVVGIYAIVNTVNGMLYIGSSRYIVKRKRDHWNLLKRDQHVNSHLQNAWNKYGEESFEFRFIEEVDDILNLLDREQFWLDTIQPYNRSIGYNKLSKAGSPENFRGYKGKGVYKGVYFDKRERKWVAVITNPKGVVCRIAGFESAEEAGKAYDSVASFFFGEEYNGLIYYNFPDSVEPRSIEEIRRDRRMRLKGRKTSRFIGVLYESRTEKWLARIEVDNKVIQIGTYESEVEAARAWDRVSLHTFRDLAKLNFPEEIIVPVSIEEAKELRSQSRRTYCNFLGVHYHKETDSWQARLTHNKKIHYLGYYKTPEEAAIAFDFGHIQIRGKDVQLNFPYLQSLYLKSESINQILQKGVQLQLDLGL